MTDYSQDYVPPEMWGGDHWTTLAYVETVMVECGGFQVGTDPHMRSNRRHVRVMRESCARPKRPIRVDPDLSRVMDPAHTTILADGTSIPGHDDWCCLQDLAAAGLFTMGPEGVEPRQVLHLSQLGKEVVSALRSHKAEGGKFTDFKWQPAAEPTIAI